MLLAVIAAFDLGSFVSALQNHTRHAIAHAPLTET
jgi:hypothetical protein